MHQKHFGRILTSLRRQFFKSCQSFWVAWTFFGRQKITWGWRKWRKANFSSNARNWKSTWFYFKRPQCIAENDGGGTRHWKGCDSNHFTRGFGQKVGLCKITVMHRVTHRSLYASFWLETKSVCWIIHNIHLVWHHVTFLYYQKSNWSWKAAFLISFGPFKQLLPRFESCFG